MRGGKELKRANIMKNELNGSDPQRVILIRFMYVVLNIYTISAVSEMHWHCLIFGIQE